MSKRLRVPTDGVLLLLGPQFKQRTPHEPLAHLVARQAHQQVVGRKVRLCYPVAVPGKRQESELSEHEHKPHAHAEVATVQRMLDHPDQANVNAPCMAVVFGAVD